MMFDQNAGLGAAMNQSFNARKIADLQREVRELQEIVKEQAKLFERMAAIFDKPQ